ncbi:hypothetical protein AXF42_Ash014912 [Apostasia shenzhenica]|uniref:Pyridoxal phosphatase n=1 Tax=Apostasia shenzhenica TaxID=1088818 RepID=A0A2I0ALH8_9ASPA|nr:hypothetical protein AXF42_Ash014912 [Apostasia shenzhenica]
MEYEDCYRQAKRPKYECLLFDLDDTLYPLNSGLAAHCRKNIGDYMVERLGIEESKVSDLCNLLYKNYGTTMAGLRAIGYKFDYDEYHSFVHGRLPYEKLRPDPVLRNLLMSIPFRKVIFTNADKVHATKVLRKLGLEDCFEGIICFETLNPPEENSSSDQPDSNTNNIFDIIDHFSRSDPNTELPMTPVLCKPSEYATTRALQLAKINPQRTVSLFLHLCRRNLLGFRHEWQLKQLASLQIFFDDSIRNIQAGKRIGLHTVLVGTSLRAKGADYALGSIHNMREALPELWKEEEKDDVRYAEKVAIETSVTA